MPIYEYRCEACGEQTEHLQRLSDPPLAACPRCGGAVRKLISAPAFQFKGSGWYVTDYAKKEGGAGVKGAEAKSAEVKGEDGAKGSAAKEGGGQPEPSKSEAKADAKSEGKGSGPAASNTSSAA